MDDLPVFVADTHALVFYLNGDPALGARAAAAFEAAEMGRASIVVPVIVLAEVAWIVERRRIPIDFLALLAELEAHPAYRIVPMDVEQLERFAQATSIPEMHDRLIVCEAQRSTGTLITRDREITGSGAVPVVW